MPDRREQQAQELTADERAAREAAIAEAEAPCPYNISAYCSRTWDAARDFYAARPVQVDRPDEGEGLEITDALVERAAEAIYEVKRAAMSLAPWETLDDLARHPDRELARAALAAARLPERPDEATATCECCGKQATEPSPVGGVDERRYVGPGTGKTHAQLAAEAERLEREPHR